MLQSSIRGSRAFRGILLAWIHIVDHVHFVLTVFRDVSIGVDFKEA